jgi:hypothetical protein
VDAMTGKPCLSMLTRPEDWNESYSLTDILLAIQVNLYKVTTDYSFSYLILENAVRTIIKPNCESRGSGLDALLTKSLQPNSTELRGC